MIICFIAMACVLWFDLEKNSFGAASLALQFRTRLNETNERHPVRDWGCSYSLRLAEDDKTCTDKLGQESLHTYLTLPLNLNTYKLPYNSQPSLSPEESPSPWCQTYQSTPDGTEEVVPSRKVKEIHACSTGPVFAGPGQIGKVHRRRKTWLHESSLIGRALSVVPELGIKYFTDVAPPSRGFMILGTENQKGAI